MATGAGSTLSRALLRCSRLSWSLAVPLYEHSPCPVGSGPCDPNTTLNLWEVLLMALSSAVAIFALLAGLMASSDE